MKNYEKPSIQISMFSCYITTNGIITSSYVEARGATLIDDNNVRNAELSYDMLKFN